MENTSTNPLSKYFRQPSIYLKLPSEGRYWPEGSLSLPLNNELPIYPLTTKDEIILRTPDALLNGSGVVEVIQSCCPSIIDAWQTPSIDVDAILIAIRIASYGEMMDAASKCPHCEEENNHEVNLLNVLSNIHVPDYRKIEVNELKIKLKPQLFFGSNRDSSIDYAEQRIRQALEQPDIEPDVRSKEIAASIERLIEISISTITDSTEYIELPNGDIVSNKDHIKEFYNNAERKIIRQIQQLNAKIVETATLEPLTVTCGGCKKEYSLPLEFNYSSFFVVGS